jgi:hypothetical protein
MLTACMRSTISIAAHTRDVEPISSRVNYTSRVIHNTLHRRDLCGESFLVSVSFVAVLPRSPHSLKGRSAPPFLLTVLVLAINT